METDSLYPQFSEYFVSEKKNITSIHSRKNGWSIGNFFHRITTSSEKDKLQLSNNIDTDPEQSFLPCEANISVKRMSPVEMG